MTEIKPSSLRSGPWDAAQVGDFLAGATIPVRIASQGAAHPLVQSLWFLPLDGQLWCCTKDDSVLVRRLARDGRCGFEISADVPPYRGVRGSATAELVPDAAPSLLPRLIGRYGQSDTPLAQWLLSRLDREVAIRITPTAITSWDYSARM
jgi:hypothetical protein